MKLNKKYLIPNAAGKTIKFTRICLMALAARNFLVYVTIESLGETRTFVLTPVDDPYNKNDFSDLLPTTKDNPIPVAKNQKLFVEIVSSTQKNFTVV